MKKKNGRETAKNKDNFIPSENELALQERESSEKASIDSHAFIKALRAFEQGDFSIGDNIDARKLLKALRAFRQGDFSVRLPEDQIGIAGEIAIAFNQCVQMNEFICEEFENVTKTIVQDGQFNARVISEMAINGWAKIIRTFNELKEDLLLPLRELSNVITSIGQGDLACQMQLRVKGRVLKGDVLSIAKTTNDTIKQLNQFYEQVTRVAREVGTEGRLGIQAKTDGVSGVWRDLTLNVNTMAMNLTNQVRDIARVTTAVAKGDLTKQITVDVKGEILELKNTINTMVEQLRIFSAQVTHVAREVGTEGRLGGQAAVEDVSGVWKALTDNVNAMAANLTNQVRDIAQVATAVANGDLTKKVTVLAKGEILQLKDTINNMVDQLSEFSEQVTLVAREVGTEGKLGGQAIIRGVSGTWKDLTDNVNTMAANLTNQVRDIAQVATSVAHGDLTKKITVKAKGEVLELKNTINNMVEQLRTFAEEVTRVAKEVGTDGRLGGQANIEGVMGTWKALTDSVNTMANNLTEQVRDIALVATAVAKGDLTKKVMVEAKGEVLELKSTINNMVEQLRTFGEEVSRVAREVGTEGQLGGQAEVRGVSGTWKDVTDNVNTMASNLTAQVRDIAQVATAVAQGDLTKKITVEVLGEISELKNTINTMVDQLNIFAVQVSRVAREVGTEGKLGGQAEVPNISGTWKELTDNVNIMATNLTNQVRDIAQVATAVAAGDLTKKIKVEVRGEVAELKDTINQMTVTLGRFAEQVTAIAREVGVEGKLGAQAEVPGAKGIWRDLTDNVNELAANLTRQVRSISDVATAVTEGDFSRTITVEAKGEVAILKDNINKMIRSLDAATEANRQQDWLKTNLAKFIALMQGQKDLPLFGKTLISKLTSLVNAQIGAFYQLTMREGREILTLLAAYGYNRRKELSNYFELGDGLVGQCAIEKEIIEIKQVPPDYICVQSASGSANPGYVIVLPILFENTILGVLELASFHPFDDTVRAFLEQLVVNVGIVMNSVKAGMRTETLLKESQKLTYELQNQQQELKTSNEKLEQQAKSLKESEEKLKTQQEALQQSNAELEEKARMLAEQKAEVEKKNREVELAKHALEEKAQQLALTSKYKSQFLANMSHELRTPLNNLLILSENLSKNKEKNLKKNQVEYATTIYSSGMELLNLINEILDLSKIESGTMSIEVGEVTFQEIIENARRNFAEIIHQKGLEFKIELGDGLPRAITTDGKRLQQIIKNLLSNAFKFTHQGQVILQIYMANMGWDLNHKILNNGEKVIAFAVKDTGIGIASEKHQLIFEAFQQVDATTSRKYGGTGLGLSISREIAMLLGGEIKINSKLGLGSTFTLYLPVTYNEITQNKDLVKYIYSSKANENVEAHSEEIKDDRNNITEGDTVVLIVDHDKYYAEKLLKSAHENQCKAIVSVNILNALNSAKQYKPHAIILNMQYSDIMNWALLDQFKYDPETRHIPVITLANNQFHQKCLLQGSVYACEKPDDRILLQNIFQEILKLKNETSKNVLILSRNYDVKKTMLELFSNGNIQIDVFEIIEDALLVAKQKPYKCAIIDFDSINKDKLVQIGKMEFEEKLKRLPIIIYIDEKTPEITIKKIKKSTKFMLVKTAHSIESVFSEAMMYIHYDESKLIYRKQKILQALRDNNPYLKGRCLLIVDDDVRNIFAISTIFEEQEMKIEYAENGREALALLENNNNIDIVLMDIMMPGMDGYETIQKIRQSEKFKNLPIITVTANAMKGDREKCINAGASDYITKPIDTKQLLSLVRVWLN